MGRPKKDAENPEDEGKSSLDLLMSAAEKQFGRGVLFRSTDKALEGTEWIPSGCVALDKALGGGYARGRFVEIYGMESSGKTTLALHAIAEAQKMNLTCAFIDAEHALDLSYARKLHVDIEKLLISQPMCGEDAIDLTELLTRSKEIGLIIIDSVAALTPKVELEGEMADSNMGLQARLMSKAMRKLCGIAAENNVTIIFINQIRNKIGIVYGSPDVTTGGNALKFYASQRLDIRRRKPIGEDGKDKTGVEAHIKVVKNKVAPPFREVDLVIKFDEGIDWVEDLLQQALASGKLVRQAASFLIGEEKVGFGMDKFKEEIRNNDKNISTRLKELLQ